MVCPKCDHQTCRRSRRKDAEDEFMFKGLGLRPWRCEQCEARFYAWLVPASRIFYAHCERCGNVALEQIAASEVPDGPFRLLKLLFRIRAYRCDPCRHRFFSLLPARGRAAERVRTQHAVNARLAKSLERRDGVSPPPKKSPVAPLEQSLARPLVRGAARSVEQTDAPSLPGMAPSAWIPPVACPEIFGNATRVRLSTPTTENPRQNGKRRVIRLSQVSGESHKNGKASTAHVGRPKKARK